MSKILVIDDDRDLRKLMKHMLESEGHEVHVATDGAEGLEMQRTFCTDVIVTDIFMPNKDGIETIRSVREEFPEVRIIAVSGGGRLQTQGHLFTAKEIGAAMILRKPFEMAALIDAVDGVLKH